MNRLKQFQFLLLSILFTSGVTAERYSVNEDSFGGVSAKPVEAVTPTNNDSLSSNHALTNTLDNNHTDGEQAEETPQANDAAANQEVTSSAAINPRQDKLGPTKAIGEVPAKRKLSVFEKAYYDAERKAQAEALKNLQTSSQDSLGAYDATKVDPVKFMDGDELERTGARKDVEKAPYFITVDVDGKPINTHYDPVLVSEALDKQRNKKIEYTQARVYEEYNHTGNSAALDLPEGADPVAAQLLSSGEKEFNLYFEAFTQHCCQQLPNIVTPSVEFGRPRGFKLTQEDLYYRLYVIPLHLPPLRERGEDVIEIAYSLLGYMSVEEGKAFVRFAQEVLDRFNQYEWPGNVRQLQNVLRNVVVLNNGKEITLNMLPPPLNQPIESSLRLKEMQNEDITVKDIFPLWITEKTAIEQAIKACDGNIPRAAGFLDVSPSTIYRKLQTWNAKQ